MAPKGNRTGSTAQFRSHSRSSSASRPGTNLQFTQKDTGSTKGSDKTKKTPHEVHARPGFVRANSTQRVAPAAQMKRTGSSTSVTQRKSNPTKVNAGFTLTSQSMDDDEDEWVSSSGAQTPNQDDSDSTASEGSSIPQQLAQKLQLTELEQHRQQEATAARAQPQLPRVETARQSDFNPMIAIAALGDNSGQNVNGMPKSAPPPTQTPFPTSISELNDPSNRSPQQRHQPSSQLQSPLSGTDQFGPSDSGDSQQHKRETNYSRQAHLSSSKRKSVTRPLSSHSSSSRLDSLPMRPHPLIRGYSQGYLNFVPKPTPLAPLVFDQTSDAPDSTFPSSPDSTKTTLTSPGGYTAEFPAAERRTSFSSTRSAATLPAHGAVYPSKPHDRTRTLSTMSASSSALNSLAHLPSVTRPPSPQQISFFPPVNPHVNIEAIHPLLPGPYLNNHLTVLARRTPLRESYDRVIQAKLTSGR